MPVPGPGSGRRAVGVDTLGIVTSGSVFFTVRHVACPRGHPPGTELASQQLVD